MSIPQFDPSPGFLGSFLSSLSQQAPNVASQLTKMGEQKRSEAKTLADAFKKQQEDQRKLKERSFKDLDAIQKFYGTKATAEQKERILPFFTEAQLAGLSPQEAYDVALQKYEDTYPTTTAQIRQEAFEKKSPITKAFRRNVPLKERRKQDIEARQKAFEERGSPVREPGEFLTGILESPVTQGILSLFNPEMAGKRAAQEGFGSLLRPFQKFKEPTTELQKKTRAFGREVPETVAKEAVGMVALGGAGKLLSKAAKPVVNALLKTPAGKSVANAIKQFGKQFGEKRVATAINETAQTIESNPTFFTPEGKLNEKGARAFYKELSNKVKQRAPTSKEARVRKESRFGSEGAEEIVEEQLRKARQSKIGEEVAEEAERYSKRPKTTPKQELLKSTAEKKVGRSRKVYNDLSTQRRRVEDSLARGEKTYSKEDLGKIRNREEAALENYRADYYEYQTGKPYRSQTSLRDDAYNSLIKIDKLADDLKIPLTEEVLHPKGSLKKETLEKVIKDAKKKKLPGQATEDTFAKVHDVYANLYAKELERVNKELLRARFEGGESFERLQRKKLILENRLSENLAKQGQHFRRQTLRRMNRLVKLMDKDRFKILDAVTTKPKVAEKIGKAIGDAFKKSNFKSAEAAKSATAPEIREAIPDSLWSVLFRFFKKPQASVLNRSLRSIGITPTSAGGRGVKVLLRYSGIPLTAGGTAAYLFKRGKGESLSTTLKRRRKK